MKIKMKKVNFLGLILTACTTPQAEVPSETHMNTAGSPKKEGQPADGKGLQGSGTESEHVSNHPNPQAESNGDKHKDENLNPPAVVVLEGGQQADKNEKNGEKNPEKGNEKRGGNAGPAPDKLLAVLYGNLAGGDAPRLRERSVVESPAPDLRLEEGKNKPHEHVEQLLRIKNPNMTENIQELKKQRAALLALEGKQVDGLSVEQQQALDEWLNRAIPAVLSKEERTLRQQQLAQAAAEKQEQERLKAIKEQAPAKRNALNQLVGHLFMLQGKYPAKEVAVCTIAEIVVSLGTESAFLNKKNYMDENLEQPDPKKLITLVQRYGRQRLVDLQVLAGMAVRERVWELGDMIAGEEATQLQGCLEQLAAEVNAVLTAFNAPFKKFTDSIGHPNGALTGVWSEAEANPEGVLLALQASCDKDGVHFEVKNVNEKIEYHRVNKILVAPLLKFLGTETEHSWDNDEQVKGIVGGLNGIADIGEWVKHA